MIGLSFADPFRLRARQGRFGIGEKDILPLHGSNISAWRGSECCWIHMFARPMVTFHADVLPFNGRERLGREL